MLIITCASRSDGVLEEFDRIRGDAECGVVILPSGGAQSRPPMRVEHIADGTGKRTVLWDELERQGVSHPYDEEGE